ncbi:MAG: acetolactate synthase large subunit [Proteobacteria bacterium]|nr:acetolactate synthase large subunit [Pseudomonadota bacterium]
MKASDLFVKALEAEGVRRIFGVPGEENADFMMSLEDSSIDFVLCRHEQSAAFMADVHGRLTGEAGVCLGTLGPGAANLVTGVADANMDRAPLVVLTGQADSRRQHKESHQNMDVVGMFRPVTKWAWSLVNPDNIPEVVRKAFKLATTEKPGACHIELPEDIAKMDATTLPILPERVRRPVPDDKIVNRAMDVIRAAQRPVILAGNGTVRRRASKQLRRFVEATGIGVVSTFMAKGCVDRNDPRSLFTIGLQAKDYVSFAIDDADVVICLGYDMVEYHPKLWNPNADKRIIHIDFLPAEVDHFYPVEVEVVGDLAHTLWMLNQRTEWLGNAPLKELPQQAIVRQQMLEDFAAHAADDTEGTIRPQKALWDVREVMGAEDILLSDVGAHKMWIARYYQCEEPNTCLISNGFCSMGFALPGAIGAKLVHPDREVLAICGDGGFLMNVHEMETAKRLGTKIVVMVWEDHEYGLISWKQDTEFGKHTSLSFENPDFMKLADAFGWEGIRCDRSRDLRGALEKAFAANRPALLVIPIDYRENLLLTERLGNIVCPI